MKNNMYAIRYGNERYLSTAERFTEYAKEHNFNPVSLAVKWVSSHPAVTAPLIGARNVDQMKDSLGSTELEMSPEMRSEISALSEAPGPATDRNEENSSFNYAAVLKR
ncbi:MAG: aldo/keto reductase [Spirochaetales bacterium]|nr:aldo/keto reductase [Spirochaetales bacterium]